MLMACKGSLHVSRDSTGAEGGKLGDRRRYRERGAASWNPTHLSGTTIADKHELEGGGLLLSHLDGRACGVVATGGRGCKQAGCCDDAGVSWVQSGRQGARRRFGVMDWKRAQGKRGDGDSKYLESVAGGWVRG